METLRRKPVVLILVLAISLVLTSVCRGPVHADSSSDKVPGAQEGTSEFSRDDTYEIYLEKHTGALRPDAEVILQAFEYSGTNVDSPEILNDHDGSKGPSLLTPESGFFEWTLQVEKAGFYNIEIDYYPVEGRSSAIERELIINGQIPFQRAMYLSFSRVWKDAHEIKRDNRDNDLRPGQVEAPEWRKAAFSDYMGYYNEPYLFYFKAGENTIKLTAVKEPMLLKSIRVANLPQVVTYAEKLDEYKKAGLEVVEDFYLEVEGESAERKSDPMLYPIYDRTSPFTQPYHKSKIRLNTIGGYRWVMPGQWISWELDVPREGLYRIAIKSRQNMVRGLYTNRQLTVNGEVPFKEMENLIFHFNSGWQMKVLGQDDDSYLFHLKEGKNELRMEVVLGGLSEILRTAEESVYELNGIYRRILMLTGSVPDPFRDYQIHRVMPEVITGLEHQSKIIDDLSKQLEEYTGQRGSHNAILNRLANQLGDLAEYPDTIPKRLDAFQANIGALSQWILSTREQPLEIDFLVVSSPDKDLPAAESGLWGRILHEIRAFLASFYEDYDTVGSTHEDAIKVWIGTGRDQAQVLKDMIDDTFTPESGIHVNLELVQAGVLLPATVAGRAPDVAMQVAVGEPVNMAVRKAVTDLSGFPGFGDVTTRFHDSALEPYKFEGGVYALPEEQMFPMLFYRKDILEELGVDVPQTWDDIFELLPIIQKKHMNFAIPISEQGIGGGGMKSYAIMLFQNGGEFYEGEGISSAIDSEAGIDAFRKWTGLYVNYKIPLQMNIVNRFRTGEVPVAINDYSLYNVLSVFAPELKGQWEFAPIPGVIQSDGTIDRSAPSAGTGVMLMNQSKNKDTAWLFMEWWTRAESQVRFAREMESLMGPAARYPTANIEALDKMPWPVNDYESLMEQWEWVKGVPEVPGGYFTPRHLDNAFRAVVLNGDDHRETLLDYVRVINEEIDNKRMEFGLETSKEREERSGK